ncbi:MAG: hypothetical protein RIE08_10185 [Acidimicrobiales bacterium]
MSEHTEHATAEFDRRFRGYDRAAVDAHVERARDLLARRERELDEAHGRLDDLRREVDAARQDAADANAAAARAGASARVFDHIVRLARETAAGIVEDARRQASEDPARAVPLVAAVAEPVPVVAEGDQTDDDGDGGDGDDIESAATDKDTSDFFAEPRAARVTFNHSAAMELFDDETADDKWDTFTDSEAGRAFFADEAVDERSRRWMLTG